MCTQWWSSQTKVYSKEYQEDPVNKFQDKTTDGNAAVIFAAGYTSKFILDDGHQCGKQEKDGYMAMDKKALENNGKILIQRHGTILEAV